jgi:hypothetical protein
MNTTEQSHCYLFTLEVDPLEVNKAYDELLLHCTLMPRFWSKLTPDKLAASVKELFDETLPLPLIADKSAKLGPKQLPVSLLQLTSELSYLNMQLYNVLNSLGVTYESSQWVGEKHIFHVTDREHTKLAIGDTNISKTAYLIETRIPGNEHQRVVHLAFALGNEAIV